MILLSRQVKYYSESLLLRAIFCPSMQESYKQKVQELEAKIQELESKVKALNH